MPLTAINERYLVDRYGQALLRSSSTTKTYKAGSRKWLVNANGYQSPGLWVFGHVKARAERIGPANLPPKPYFLDRGGAYANGVFFDMVEVDISRAYWTAAHIAGLSEKKYYRKVLQNRGLKWAGNASVGALAARRDDYILTPGQAGKVEREHLGQLPRPHACHYWRVASYVDSAIRDVIARAEQDVAFYYVDAIFFRDRPGLRERVAEGLRHWGLDSHVVRLDAIAIRGQKAAVHNADGTRRFNLPPKNRILGKIKI